MVYVVVGWIWWERLGMFRMIVMKLRLLVRKHCQMGFREDGTHAACTSELKVKERRRRTRLRATLLKS